LVFFYGWPPQAKGGAGDKADDLDLIIKKADEFLLKSGFILMDDEMVKRFDEKLKIII